MARRDEPICRHPEMSHRVANESQTNEYQEGKPLRMARVCHRPECILDGLAWVTRGTGERAWWAAPGDQHYRNDMPVLAPVASESDQ